VIARTICKFSIGVSGGWCVNLSGTILTSNNVGACSWTNRLLSDLAISNGVGTFSHVCVNVWQNVDTSVLVDIVDTILLGESLSRHIVKSVDNKLECTIGESRVGSLNILVVGHELIKNSLLGELIDLSRVSNLSLVLEGLLVLNVWADVQEVADNTGVAHPRVNGSLHELGLVLADLTGRVASIASVSISILLGIAIVVVVIVVIVVVPVRGLIAGLVIARVGVGVGVAVVPVLRSSNRKGSQKESGRGNSELHFGDVLNVQKLELKDSKELKFLTCKKC
jgi:hypothetical protein